MELMLIIAGGVALGGVAVIYRKPIAIGLLGLTGFAVLLILGLWAANAFTEPVIQHMIAKGWGDARAYEGEIWWTISLLPSALVFCCALQFERFRREQALKRFQTAHSARYAELEKRHAEELATAESAGQSGQLREQQRAEKHELWTYGWNEEIRRRRRLAKLEWLQ